MIIRNDCGWLWPRSIARAAARPKTRGAQLSVSYQAGRGMS
jgi:hypothetical protein